MTARFCDRHHSWLCGYGEGRCQRGDLWAGSGAVGDEGGSEPEPGDWGGTDGPEGLTGPRVVSVGRGRREREAQRGGEGREG